jgi:aryl-alcohol dehydrogenase-like predicted oxidoreductase
MIQRAVLGRTGLDVGRLGISASYGVPGSAVEQAFEQGVNYIYWGSMRRADFGSAIRNLARERERMVLVIQSYSRLAGLVAWSLERALRQLRLDYCDVLLLGMWNKPVPRRILDACEKLRSRGLVRWLALSTHHRPLVVANAMPDVDVFHLRYNALHPGAEKEVFPYLETENPPGIVSFTATSWGQLIKRGVSAGDCYRFVLSRPEVNVCLTGPANAEQMREALDAMRRGPLNEDELARVRRLAHPSAH